jgi:hypothetical protein
MLPVLAKCAEPCAHDGRTIELRPVRVLLVRERNIMVEGL